MTEGRPYEDLPAARPGLSDPAAVRAEYDRLMRLAAQAAVRPVATGFAAIYVALIPLLLLLTDGVVEGILVAVAGTSAVVHTMIARCCDRHPVEGRGHRVVMAMAGSALLNAVLPLALVRDPELSWGIALVVVVSGVVLFRHRYLGAIVVLSLVAYGGIGAASGFGGPHWPRHTAVLLAAAGLAALFYHARNRFVWRVAALEIEGRTRDARLAVGEARYRHLMEVSPVMVCVHDLDGRILDVNPKGAAGIGLAVDDLLGSRFTEFLVNRDSDVHVEYMRDLIEHGESSDTARIRTADGEVRTWCYESRLFRDPQKGRYAIVAAQDVTDLEEARARLEGDQADLRAMVHRRTAELREKEEHIEAESAARRAIEERLGQQHALDTLGRLAGGVVHEFNNILAVLRGYAELSMRGVIEPSRTAEQLEDVERAADRGAELVRQILAFSHPDQDTRGPLEMGPFLGEVSSRLRRTLPRNVELQLSGAARLGFVEASRVQISQVLTDLVENSTSALEGQGGVVRIRAGRRVEDEGEWIRIEVRDNGPGVPESSLGRIFDPFFTSHADGDRRGLGLAVANSIVRSHGGNIWFENLPGGGGLCVFELPASREPQGTSATSGVGHPDGPILVVDDERAIRTLVRQALEDRGHEVIEAANAQMALLAFDGPGASVALVVSDISMPGLGGEALVRRVRAHVPGMPVLLLTGLASTLDVAPLARGGPTELLGKPFCSEAVGDAVERLLARVSPEAGA